MAMGSSDMFKTVEFEDGMVAVVRTDPGKPRFLELVATFYDASHARDYADRENSRSDEHTAELTEAPTRPAVEPPAAASELSARQSAVLGVLRSKMDANKQVEAKAAVLAEAANIPLGSLHSVLAFAGKETAHQNRPRRLGASTRRLSSAAADSSTYR